MHLDHSKVLITGANRGIGLAIAREMAKHPVHLLLGARKPPARLQPEWRKTKALSVHWVPMDLSSYASIESCCDKLGEELHEIDVLVNNAGFLENGLVDRLDMERVYTMIQTNLTGWIHLTARVLPGMLRRRTGRIVNNGSISCYTHFPSSSAYAATKGEILAFTNGLRRELRGTGVSTLLLITPGVRTDMYEETERVHGPHIAGMESWPVISPEAWAKKTVDAIRGDVAEMWPGGSIGARGSVARYLPWLFDFGVARIFRRGAAGAE
jgi:short-subunit dehydrogenase